MNEAPHILVVEDDNELRPFILSALALDGHQVSEAADGNEALELLKKNIFQLAIIDIRIPGPDGLELLAYIQEHTPATPVIVITGFANVGLAVEAMQRGAFDFHEKPLNLEHLRLGVNRALERTSLLHAFDYLRHEQPFIYRLDKILAESEAMKQVVGMVRRVAPTDVTVLLTGESGTGKSLVAGAIHANSPRRDHTLVTVNCSALTETLLESELFGHEKGAFTGAHIARAGRIQQANGGTLFLDEVGEMVPATQAKMLRAIEDKVIQRVGGSREVRVDVRIVAATNRNLQEAVAQGEFREDLFYRLNVASIHIPPLRERIEDILPLAEKFLRHLARDLKRRPVPFSKAAREALEANLWPGNIRELRNAVERALLFTQRSEISPADLGLIEDDEETTKAFTFDSLNLANLERWAIEGALERSEWVQSRAATLLGISPRALIYKIKKYNINHPRLEARRRRR